MNSLETFVIIDIVGVFVLLNFDFHFKSFAEFIFQVLRRAKTFAFAIDKYSDLSA